MKANLSITFYQKTDGQSKITNKKIKKYFSTFINSQQDDQSEKLVIAKLAANNDK